MLLLSEIVDMVLMTAILGFLFKDAFRPPPKGDILDQFKHPKGTNWYHFWWACALVAPSIILHEMGHKFMALGFGKEAVFHAACSVTPGGLFNGFCLIQAMAVVLKALGFGFFIFIPGFVSITGVSLPWQDALISFAGPAIHLIFWLGAAWVMRDHKRMKRMKHQHRLYLFFFKQINMFLFILNILPIPGFDGWHVLMSVIAMF